MTSRDGWKWSWWRMCWVPPPPPVRPSTTASIDVILRKYYPGYFAEKDGR